MVEHDLTTEAGVMAIQLIGGIVMIVVIAAALVFVLGGNLSEFISPLFD